MAEERLKALVRRAGPQPDVHLSVWGRVVGKPGQYWIEDDGRGVWLVKVLRSPARDGGDSVGTLVRPAQPSDEQRYRQRAAQVPELIATAQEKVRKQGLPMQLLTGELDLEGRFLRIFFTAPGRVDFRELLRELSKALGMRIELRQVGPRDVARLLGGVGPCGRPICCRTFLRQLRPIPLELAFDQQLFFSPERVTGCCGRLMCCLAYEHSQYLEAMEGVPKVGAKVELKGRRGKVTAINIFRSTLTVAWEDGTREEVPWEQWRRGGPAECPPGSGS